MPQYYKKRRAFYPYNGLPLPTNMILGMPPLHPGLFAAPQFQFQLPVVPVQAPNSVPVTNVPGTAPLPSPEPPSKAERACLPFFEDELTKTQPREPTDILIIDFDQTLLGTPSVNPELVGKESKKVLEKGMGVGFCWQQSRAVLEAAIARAQWDEDLVEVAREASKSDSVVLVITTARQMSEISLIEDALDSQGINRIDHFACTYSNSGKEDEDDAEKDADLENNFVLDSWAKQVMLELLLESYETLERVVIFDSNKRDRTKFKKIILKFVYDGWLHGEAFQIPDLLPKQTQLESVQDQRQLIENVVNAANLPLEKSIVVVEWCHKLTVEAKLRLARALVSILGEGLLHRLFSLDINIVKGSLPSNLRALATQRGQIWHWVVSGFKIRHQVLWLMVRSDSGSGFEYLKTARLMRGVEDVEVNFAHASVPLTPPASAATVMPSLASLSMLSLETFVYEHRQLRLQKKRL